MLELPSDRVRPKELSYRGWQEVMELESELTDGLKKMSQQERVTLFMLLLSAYAILLSPYAKQDEVLVCAINTGRTRAETRELIGFFLNNLVLRTDMRGNPTFRELLARVRAMVLGAYANQHVPFSKLIEELRPERTMSRTPLAQIVFNFLPFEGAAVNLPNLTITPIGVPTPFVPFELAMNVTDSGKGLLVSMQYNTDLFNASSIRSLLGNFKTLLSTLHTQRDLRLSELKEFLGELNRKRRADEQEDLKQARLQKFAGMRRRGAVESKPM